MKTKEALAKAVEREPQYVEVETVLGSFPAFKGYLDTLPAGGVFYATEGKLAAGFRRVGKRIFLQ